MQFLCSLGHGSSRSLHLNLQQKEQMLRKGLIIYLGVASEYTGALSYAIWKDSLLTSLIEPEITVVLSPLFTTPRHQDKASRFIGK